MEGLQLRVTKRITGSGNHLLDSTRVNFIFPPKPFLNKSRFNLCPPRGYVKFSQWHGKSHRNFHSTGNKTASSKTLVSKEKGQKGLFLRVFRLQGFLQEAEISQLVLRCISMILRSIDLYPIISSRKGLQIVQHVFFLQQDKIILSIEVQSCRLNLLKVKLRLVEN